MCQMAANFTVTDTEGQTHNLYESYLNQGKTVVIKFFFTTCPPCISISPQWQQKYEDWGAGANDVEFIEASILGSDTNAKVKTFKTNYGLTMIGIGSDGNASNIVSPYQSGTYGPWYGTPSFAVIAPDGNLQYPLFFSDLEEAIAATGAVKPTNIPDPTIIQLSINSYNIDIPDGHVKYFVKPIGLDQPKIEIIKDNNGQYSFEYPSDNFPEMDSPEIIMESHGPDYTTKITAADIVTIQKHILDIEKLSPSYKEIAADVTNDGKITAYDLVTIRKLILQLITDFPNDTPAYIGIPNSQVLTPNPGNTVQINMSIIKTGNVN